MNRRRRRKNHRRKGKKGTTSPSMGVSPSPIRRSNDLTPPELGSSKNFGTWGLAQQIEAAGEKTRGETERVSAEREKALLDFWVEEDETWILCPWCINRYVGQDNWTTLIILIFTVLQISWLKVSYILMLLIYTHNFFQFFRKIFFQDNHK